MKTNIKSLFLIVLIFFPIAVSAQNGIIEQMPVKLLDTTIIRDWKENMCILYYKDFNTNKGYFCVEDNTSSIIQMAEINPYVDNITDFRVHKDSVFFCGKYKVPSITGNSEGAVVGFFDINNLFFSPTSDFIHYGQFPDVYDPSAITHFNLLQPQRMDLYTYQGITHIVLVGTTSQGTRSVTSTTLCDVYYNGGWTANQYENGNGNIVFTDVASSGAFVAVAAKRRGLADYYAGVYLPSSNILTTPLYSGILFNLGGNAPLDDLLIESIAPERFVMTHYSKFATYYGTEYDMFDVNMGLSTVTPLFYWQVYHGDVNYYNMGWRLKRLCYHPVQRRMLLLHDISCPVLSGIESVIFSLDMTLTGTPAGIQAAYYPTLTLKEFDRFGSGFYHAIGQILPNRRIGAIAHEWNLSIAGCRNEFVPEYDVSTLSMTENPYSFVLYSPLVRDISISSTVSELETSTICEQ